MNDPLAEIAAWEVCWTARMEAGFYGPVTHEENGNRYGDAEVIDGKLVRGPKESQPHYCAHCRDIFTTSKWCNDNDPIVCDDCYDRIMNATTLNLEFFGQQEREWLSIHWTESCDKARVMREFIAAFPGVETR